MTQSIYLEINSGEGGGDLAHKFGKIIENKLYQKYSFVRSEHLTFILGVR